MHFIFSRVFQSVTCWIAVLLLGLSALPVQAHQDSASAERPNILLVISDDQSWPHASAYGTGWTRTPAFDRVAREGVLFANAFVDAPACSPSRAALLTGRHIWQIEQAGSHWSFFPKKYAVFPNLLEEAGYFIGHTGKGWAPGNWKVNGWAHDPAGPAYEDSTLRPPVPAISSNDYAANFADFLEAKQEGQPFYFWFGAHEAHRPYAEDFWQMAGKDTSRINVPAFLPDVPVVREHVATYAAELEYYDEHLGRMLRMLEARGELDNTLVIVTSDNGMPFPGAKSTVYEYGIHVPLAIRWGAEVPAGRRVSDLVNLIDLAPTILQAAGVPEPTEYPMAGHSILPLLKSPDEGRVDPSRTHVFTGRERHGPRWKNLSYPQRAVRTRHYLYIRNFKPERWPQKPPSAYPKSGSPAAYLVSHRRDPDVRPYYEHALAPRPPEQLYDLRKDPACMNNLIGDPAYQAVEDSLSALLGGYLMKTEDPRVTGRGNVWEAYPYFGPKPDYPRPDWVDEVPHSLAQAVEMRRESPRVPPDTTGPVHATLPRAERPIAIDGGAGTAWEGVPSHALTTGGVSSEGDLSGAWQAAWDDEHLYVLVKVTDDTLADSVASVWRDDGVRLFIDAENNKTIDYYDWNDFQYGFRPGDEQVHRGYLSAPRAERIDFAFRRTEGGYVFEAALPWSTLRARPEAGHRLGLAVRVTDNDGTGREGGAGWHAAGTAWQNPSRFGTVRLVSREKRASGQARQAFHNMGLWPDESGTHINAHAGEMLYYEGRYYWFGMHMSPHTNTAQVGVHVYSSDDLYDWKDEGIALAVSENPQSDIAVGSRTERPKVVYNDSSDTFVMWFHLELKGRGYEAARTAVAVAEEVTGPYRYLRSMRPNAGRWPINFPHAYKSGPEAEGFEWYTDRWRRAIERGLYVRRDFEGGQMARDMDLFVDEDGTAYHIHSSEENQTLHISELTDDYTGFTGRYARVLPAKANEAPAVWKHEGTYWMIASGLSGWKPNAARSAMADSIFGSWEMVGNPARGENPKNGLGPEKTFGAQITDVFKVHGREDAFIAMFDVWRPQNPIDGRYIWLPITFEDGRPIVRYRETWDLSIFGRGEATAR